MKLSDLLKNKKLNYLIPLNENGDYEREVATVESTETPDVYAYIGRNALVITTAMYYADRQGELINLIENLVQKNCCGLAIKVDRFLKKLDKQVLDRANELRFPILLIPAHITLGEVYQDILTNLWQDTKDDLVFALNSQKMFSNILLQDKGVEGILNTLSNILKVEAVLVDPFGNIEYSSKYFANSFDKNEVRQIVGSVPSKDIKYFSGTISDMDGVSHNTGIYTMRVTAQYPYYLLLLNTEKLRYPVASFIIDQAIFSVSITKTRELGTDYHKLERTESLFLNLLKLCSKEDKEAILEFVHNEKLEYFTSGRTAVLYFPNFSEMFPSHLEITGYTLIYNWLEMKFSKVDNYKLYPLRNENMYIIQTSDRQLQVIVDNIKKILDILNEVLGINLSISIGAEFLTYNYQYQSYREALKGIEHGVPYGEYDNVKVSRPQDFRALFAHISAYEIQFFSQSVLGDLYTNDSKNYVDYRETLRTWLMNKTDVSKTAREMFIHRNTAIYRLERCKEILHSDFSDPEELFNLEIALNLMEF